MPRRGQRRNTLRRNSAHPTPGRGAGAFPDPAPRREFLFILTTLALGFAVQRPAAAQEPVRVLATGVFATALRSLADPFAADSGYKLEISIANAGQVAARVTAGEPADVVLSSAAGIKTLIKQGFLTPHEIPVGKMRLGVGVRVGTPGPALSSPEAFRSLLLSAGKIAYIDPNGGGTSGPFFEKMLASLGVADAVHAKALLCKDGAEIATAVASGAAAIGMTQASEIIGAEGVGFAGYIPQSLNLTTPYSGALTARSRNSKPAMALLEFVGGPVGADHFRRAGWDLER